MDSTNNSNFDENDLALFLLESAENLELFETSLLELEKDPENLNYVHSMFRAIHTIKGSCTSLNFASLANLTHSAENILDKICKQHKAPEDIDLISIFLDLSDQIREILASIESNGHDSITEAEQLKESLQVLSKSLISSNESDERKSKKKSRTLNPLQLEALASLGKAGQDVIARNQVAEASKIKEQTIRVNKKTINKLGGLVAELLLVRNRIVDLGQDLDSNLLSASSFELDKISNQIKSLMFETRMQSLGSIASKLKRIVRDTAKQLAKEVDFEIKGAQTKLDRTILEAISDPLVHLIRNSIDHGIEDPDTRERLSKPRKGKLSLEAFYEANTVEILISDDGSGVSIDAVKQKALASNLRSVDELAAMSDYEIIDLIFEPGFSVKDEASNISGRGFGMDVVRSKIRKLDGDVVVLSQHGEGTKISIKVPLSQAIGSVVLVNVADVNYAINQYAVEEIISRSFEELCQEGHETYIRHRSQKLPLLFARDALNNDFHHKEAIKDYQACENIPLIIIETEGYKYALVVDEIVEMTSLVVKPLNYHRRNFRAFSATTITAEGEAALIFDLRRIARLSGLQRNISDLQNIIEHRPREKNIEIQEFLSQFDRNDMPDCLVPFLESRIDGLKEDKAQEILGSDSTMQVLAFYVGTYLFAIDLNCVKEVLAARSMTPVPSAEEAVKGLINIRSKVVLVKELAKVFAIDTEGFDLEEIIVLNVNDQLFAFEVGLVSDISKIDESEQVSIPARLPSKITETLSGVYRVDGQHLFLLDHNQLSEICDVLGSQL